MPNKGKFNKLDWSGEEKLTTAKLNQLADNGDYLNQRKIEGALRNTSPDKTPRGGIKNIRDNLAMYAEYKEISPAGSFPEEQVDKKVAATFTVNISFPQGFFNPAFLPVVVASVGVKSGIKNLVYTIKNISASGFNIQVRELTNQNFTDNMEYFVSYIAIGVKNA